MQAWSAHPPAVTRCALTGGPYEIGEEIGHGGIARIHVARDVHDPWGRTLAAKMLRPRFSRDPEYLAHLDREARLVCELSHPNIVEVLDYGYQDGDYMVVMEYVHGLSLGRLMSTLETRRLRLPESIAMYLGLETLRPLAYLHGRSEVADGPIVHRDISPGNLLLDYRGRMKLIDFGIARPEQAPPSDPGRLRGKLGYLSPEQARGDGIDHRSDLFSFAVVLAELLLQRRYFVGDDPTVVIENVLRADTTTLERVGDRLPPELELILRVALDPLPEQRFQSAQELETALVDFVRHCDWQLPTAHSVSSWLRVNRLIPSRSGVHPIELPRSETRERPRIIEEHERAHRRHG